MQFISILQENNIVFKTTLESVPVANQYRTMRVKCLVQWNSIYTEGIQTNT